MAHIRQACCIVLQLRMPPASNLPQITPIFAIYRSGGSADFKEYSMSFRNMKLSSRALGAMLALGLAGVSLAGCVYYPSGYGYGYGPAYAPGYVYAPPVGVVVGGGWGGGWGRGGWR